MASEGTLSLTQIATLGGKPRDEMSIITDKERIILIAKFYFYIDARLKMQYQLSAKFPFIVATRPIKDNAITLSVLALAGDLVNLV